MSRGLMILDFMELGFGLLRFLVCLLVFSPRMAEAKGSDQARRRRNFAGGQFSPDRA